MERPTARNRRNALGAVAGMTKSPSENWEGSCFRGEGQMARRDEGGYPQRSLTEEQRRQVALPTKTLRAARSFGVGRRWLDRHSPLRDAPVSPPWPTPKSRTAGPLPIFRQALKSSEEILQSSMRGPRNNRSHFLPHSGTSVLRPRAPVSRQAKIMTRFWRAKPGADRTRIGRAKPA